MATNTRFAFRENLFCAILAASVVGVSPGVSLGQSSVNQGNIVDPAGLTFADIATYADVADIVAVVQVRRQILVEPERSPGLAPGKARLYLQVRTEALLGGSAAIGESLTYLADVPLTESGKPPKLRRKRFVIFADSVPGRPSQLQLVAPHAQFETDELVEARIRDVIAALSHPDAPPRIAQLRDAISIRGNLAGESETQIFVETQSGVPASISVIRRPGMTPQWGVSWSEIVDQAATAPARDTVEWFRLACFLPAEMPASAHLQSDRSARYQAEADYRFVLDQLGPCARNTM